MKEMAQILGMTNDGVYYHIKGLRNAGKLRRVGGRKIGHWEFKD
ncbi:MAG: helix-turn-helix transcriptional regulator [Kiritimatiellae bacterium]|jgi:predicted transcriptional regulator|nr:helix-turn-helix transcriptional regulator [Kiritimatiellia bacterium]